MKNVFSILCIVVLLPNAQATAREGAFGAGGFFDFYIPVFNFKDMYDSGTKFGGTAHYIYHKRKMVEVEFHHARFNNGSLETRTFSFSDGKDYTSPQAKTSMTINSINANWLFALREQGFGQGTTLYLTFGAGLHDYSSKVSGLIFAGQTPSGAGAPPVQRPNQMRHSIQLTTFAQLPNPINPDIDIHMARLTHVFVNTPGTAAQHKHENQPNVHISLYHPLSLLNLSPTVDCLSNSPYIIF